MGTIAQTNAPGLKQKFETGGADGAVYGETYGTGYVRVRCGCGSRLFFSSSRKFTRNVMKKQFLPRERDTFSLGVPGLRLVVA